jgi:two-component system, chemotaxis family, sensor kinase CheA
MSDSASHDPMFDSLLTDFLDESTQLLENLNENLLQLDQWVRSIEGDEAGTCEPELLNEMFRSAHSLKGLSAMLGLTDINTLTHKIENVFDAARKGSLRIDGAVVELIFNGIDRVDALVGALKDPSPQPVECHHVIEAIAQMLSQRGVEKRQSCQADAEKALSELTAEPSPAEPAPTPAPAPPVAPAASAAPAAAPAPTPATEEEDLAEKYLTLFIDETDMALDTLTETLLAVDGGGDRHTLEKLLVVWHRIKGSAASIGLTDCAHLAHRVEDMVQDLIDRSALLTPDTIDTMLKGVDCLRQYTESLRRDGAHVKFDDTLFASVAPPVAAPAPAPAEPPPAATTKLPAEFRAAALAAAKDNTPLVIGEVVFQQGLAFAGLKAQLVHEKLQQLGQVCHIDPPAEGLEDRDDVTAVWFGIIGDTSTEIMREHLWIGGVERVDLEVVRNTAANAAGESCDAEEPAPAVVKHAAKPSPTPAANAAPASDNAAAKTADAKTADAKTADAKNRPGETLRVDIERLDHLMNLTGQLVINRARLSQVGESLRTASGSKRSVEKLQKAFESLRTLAAEPSDDALLADPAAEAAHLRSQLRRLQTDMEQVCRDMTSLAGLGSSVGNLFEAVHQLDLVCNGIQQGVMDIRMVPIGPLFLRFKRVIRDITRTNNKDVRLIIKGEKTELDKRMIDELGDPLIHLVRNSADHGVELPSVREAAGKPRQGTVTLNAFHRGNSIIIQVSDDGKGLDEDRIRAKCIEKGLLSAADVEKMTRQQILQMIWEPGLSTAEKVTEVSGRGMGMDIVKCKIEALNGTVDLDSTPGVGTIFTIRLPLTLAILPSLMVEIDGDVFAVPMETVAEIVNVHPREVFSLHSRQAARVRQRVISVARLDEIFQWTNRVQTGHNENEPITMVVVGERGREIGLAVDRVLGEEDIVIKSLAENYRNVQGIAGASILGDGRVSLILDVSTVMDMAVRQPSTVG